MPNTRTIIPENLKKILICVDSYDDLLMKGVVWHPLSAKGKEFHNVMQLLFAVEEILKRVGVSKAGEVGEFPSFTAPTSELVDNRRDFQAKKGKLATFMLKIMFRQNSSWQGTLDWIEADREESFMSTFEFLMLMDSALQYRLEKSSGGNMVY